MSYNWLAALAFVIALIVMSKVGGFLVFKIPALAKTRQMNRDVDRVKLSRKRFRQAVKVNNNAGLITNVIFYIAILPFCVSFETSPFWRYLVQIFAILLIFDFFDYLVHRFIFHGKILRKVHAFHHQARKPTHIDALYVHPLETVIGLVLFLMSIPLVALISGGPLNFLAVAVATLIFTHMNTLNHVWVNLPYFPFRYIDWVTSVHAAHHVNMDSGNYATLTMVYDWMFGTFEKPVSRSEP
ncbi:MAG: sterol desaturase family protein [Myxococcota bacterium]|nr:sterol desaturase family protein [Myxococcota bacterium]